MVEFNWDAHPVANETNTKVPATATAEFDWNSHPEVEDSTSELTREPASTKPDIGMGGAALSGLGSGLAMGFDEELTSPVAAAALMAGGDTPDATPNESTWEKYKRLMQTYRDTARERKDTALEQHPYAYVGGNIAGAATGAALLPGMGGAKVTEALAPKVWAPVAKIAGGATEGAVQGAITGAGNAEGDILDRAPEAIEGAKLGAEVGGAIPVGVETAKGIGKIPIIETMTSNFTRGLRGQNLITKAGRQEAEDVIRNQHATPLINDLKGEIDSVGSQVKAVIKNATSSGEKVDLTDTIPEIRNKIAAIRKTGTKDAINFADGIESELNKVFPVEAPVVDNTYLGVDKAKLPEGIITPEPPSPVPVNYNITPEKAQDLKQAIYKHTPGAMSTSSAGLAPQEVEAAGLAGDIYKTTGQKLEEAVPELAPLTNNSKGLGLNQKYSNLRKLVDERLKLDLNDLPNNTRDKLTAMLANLEKTNVTGGNKREIIKDVISTLKETRPDLAAKYEGTLTDAVERLDVAQGNLGGGQRHGFLGTTQAMAGSGSNIVGLAGNVVTKVPGAGVAGQVIKAAATPRSVISAGFANEKRKPYEVNRQYAKDTESATPETLTAQANDLRTQYGEKANQLATILDSMAKASPDTRRALMFTVLQNPAHRKMLGLSNENE